MVVVSRSRGAAFAATSRAGGRATTIFKSHPAAMVAVGLIAAASALACASTGQTGPTAVEPADHEVCFSSLRVDSFAPLHPRFVYLRLVGGEHYLLTLDAVYPSLPFATEIRLISSFDRVCANSGARLTFRSGDYPVSCRVVHIDAVASKEAAEQLVKERTNPKAKG
jgi:hypothetical protein